MSAGGDAPLLEARGLAKSYRRGGPTRLGSERTIEAFAEVDLALEPGRVVGLVGASGAGKSSLARCLAWLEPPDRGRVLFRGLDLASAPRGARSRMRAEVQLVFQNAERAFHPLWSAREVLQEPIRLAGGARAVERGGDTIAELARLVGLDASLLVRRARDLSGGQKRRLNLARALVLEPRVLILDEPFAGLDVSLQAQIANLLGSLQAHFRFACLHISHDLAMVGRLASDVVVMDRGRIVERGPAARVLDRPEHAATRALVAARSLRTTAVEA